ncbi:GEF2 [Candida theae]|uniref:GEF2 n=1 Tax=Candida theae TaxID=1198502 RepID=A0AAD5G0H0_9ASCO|nr:GEF2 [Candida theae]KAI5966021.1 GEF2 [Candida theae]
MNSSFSSSNGSSSTYTIDEIPTLIYAPDRPNTSHSAYSTTTSASTTTTTTTAATARALPSSSTTSPTYEENTYINWSQETQRISNLPSSLSKKWTTLVLSAIILGYIAAIINLISISLNDLKKGICLSNLDAWSIFNPYSTCPANEWYNWSRLLTGSTAVWSRILINFPIYLIFAVLFAMGASYLTINREHLIRQSGIPEIKLLISGFNLNVGKYLGLHTLLFKIVGLILVVSSGLWLGKEGPLVHVSCCIFNIIYELIIQGKFGTGGGTKPNEAVRREILSAATATGISVAFNSPIGGVLFVLESMPSYFSPTKIMWNSFVAATIAIIGLTGFSAFTDGNNFLEQDLFQVNFGNFSWLFLEVIPFIALGVVGGLYGYYFTKLNQIFQQRTLRKKVQSLLVHAAKVDPKWGPFLEVLAIVVLTTLLNFPLEISKLPLSSYLILLFKQCSKDASDGEANAEDFLCSSSNGVTVLKLLYILVQGFGLTAYTFGIDLPGGVLMPSLVLGATTGRLLGIVTQVLQSRFNWESLSTCTEKSCVVSPSSYAVIGAAAFMTGITKLTMCVVVIMFEMTGAVSYVLPIMCGVVTSKFVNDWLTPSNIYDTWLQNNFNRRGQGFFSTDGSATGMINEGKGTGIVSFSNLTSTIKSKLPDVTVQALMVPLEQVKCLCLVNEHSPYTAESLWDFVNDDTHEGYPIIINYSNPVYIGYVTKLELVSKLQTVNREDSSEPISFQIANLPRTALSMQLHYERKNNNCIHLNLSIEASPFYTNEQSPAILILEEFEKLYLNHLVILSTNNVDNQIMAGFIDRFILANAINDKFGKLVNELADFEAINEYDLETAVGDDEVEMMDLRYNRKSIELIT